MTIDALPTVPNTLAPTTFAADMDAFLAALPTFRTQANALAAAMTAVAAGGAVSLQYTFDTTTADADPGAGKLRLNQAAQNTATVIRADLAGSDGSDLTNVLALIDDSTSTNKGYITLRKSTDATKWLVFSVASLASPAGYKNITVNCVASSAASPFANADAILLDFTPTGDKGETGNDAGIWYDYSTTTTAADPGSGFLRFNNTTLASATALYISETDTNAIDQAALLATWDDASNTIRGTLTMSKSGNLGIFAAFHITGTRTDNGTWDTFTVAYLTGGGAFTNNDAVVLNFQRAGDAGVLAITNITTATTGTTLTSTPTVLEITPATHGVSVTLPDATTCSEGGPFYIVDNKGAYPVLVKNNSGTLLGFVPGRVVSHISLVDNSTAAGTWTVGNAELIGVSASLATARFKYLTYDNRRAASVDLGSGREIILGTDAAAGHLYGVVYNRTTNTFGTPTVIRAADVTGGGNEFHASILVSADKVLTVSCASGAATFEAVILSISGTTITVNAAATATLSANISAFVDACGLIQVGTSFITSYLLSGPAAQIREITVSGTTPTISAATVLSGTAGGVIVAGSATVVIAISTLLTDLFTRPYSIGGLAPGTGTTTASGGGNWQGTTIKISPLSTRWGMIANYGATNDVGFVISLSGTTTTVSTVALFASVTYLDAMVVGTNKIVILGAAASSNCNIMTDTAGTASAGTAITAGTSNTRALIYADGTTVYDGDAENKIRKIDCSGASPVLTYGLRTLGNSNITQRFITPSNSYMQRTSKAIFGTKFAQEMDPAVGSANFHARVHNGWLSEQPNTISFCAGQPARGIADNERWIGNDSQTVLVKMESVP